MTIADLDFRIVVLCLILKSGKAEILYFVYLKQAAIHTNETIQMIQYISEDVMLPDFPKQETGRWIKKTALEYGKKTGEIAYIFCSDKHMLEVNNQYLQHDYYTDIITFDYSEGTIISGDIFISIDTVKSNSVEFNVSFEEELKRIMIHGILHLCGQDDKTPEMRLEMTEKENSALMKYE